ncbi:hypothetical protein [Acinetobacter haemolyticus]|uniref:hypothetical protein n=1 Tax=Acinetobacter haemolyticus TaxID=29430 RepID=UPI003F54D41E
MIHGRILTTCLLLPLCISACSKQDSKLYIPDKEDQLSQRIDPMANPRPVVIAGQKITTLYLDKTSDESFLRDFQNYIVDTKGAKKTFLALRQQLRLRPDQLLLFGVRKKDHTEIPIVDLTSPDLFSRANSLAIQHLALLKASSIPDKDPYETTDTYQQRIKAKQQQTEKLTAKANIDLGRIEDALNFSNRWIEIPDYFDQLNRIDYDADQALLTIQTTAPVVHEDDLRMVSEDALIRLVRFQVKASAEQAKSLISVWDSRAQASVYMAFVLDYQPQGLAISRVVLMEYLGMDQQFRVIEQLKPQQIYVQKVRPDLTLVQQQVIPLQQIIPFQFGISSHAETQG